MATSTFPRPIALVVAPPSPPRSLTSSASAAPALPRRNPSPLLFSSPAALAPVARRRCATLCAVSDPKIPDSEGEDQLGQDISGDTVYGPPDIQALLQSYKEAIINGDEKGIPGLEAAICNVEKEKNELVNRVAGITAEIASGKDKFLRLTADFENFRKRTDKDRLSFTSDIQSETIESLLPLVDKFESVKQLVVAETEKEKKIVTSYQGIYKQFVEIMRALRVSVVETVGKRFDPSVHEAVARVQSHRFREGIVLHEVQRGFLLGDRVLRPAKVKVSDGPTSKNAAPTDEKPPEESKVEKPPEESDKVAESSIKEIPIAESS